MQGPVPAPRGISHKARTPLLGTRPQGLIHGPESKYQPVMQPIAAEQQQQHTHTNPHTRAHACEHELSLDPPFPGPALFFRDLSSSLNSRPPPSPYFPSVLVLYSLPSSLSSPLPPSLPFCTHIPLLFCLSSCVPRSLPLPLAPSAAASSVSPRFPPSACSQGPAERRGSAADESTSNRAPSPRSFLLPPAPLRKP